MASELAVGKGPGKPTSAASVGAMFEPSAPTILGGTAPAPTIPTYIPPPSIPSAPSFGVGESPYHPSNPPGQAPQPVPYTPQGAPSPATIYSQYQGIFGPPQALNPMNVAHDIQSLFSQAQNAKITAPIATAPTVNIPGGGYDQLQESIYNAQFAPVERALEKQSARANRALAGNLAQAGLADSGAGVAQRSALARDYDQRITDAAYDISNAASAQRWNAQIAVEQQNANMALQTNLANAGFSLAAQQFNAQQLVRGNEQAAQGYLAALGINAEQAASYRSGFMQFLGIQNESALAKDKLGLDAASMLFNQKLQSASLDQDRWRTQQQIDLQREGMQGDQRFHQQQLALQSWEAHTAANANAYHNATVRMQGINDFQARMAALNQQWQQFSQSQAQQQSQFQQQFGLQQSQFGLEQDKYNYAKQQAALTQQGANPGSVGGMGSGPGKPSSTSIDTSGEINNKPAFSWNKG